MKKILSLLVLLVVFTSCEEDVKFNTPAVQGYKNNDLWKADEFTATVNSSGRVVITAINEFETVVLRMRDRNPGVYTVGLNQSNAASYTISELTGVGDSFQTNAEQGIGEIIISADPRETNLAAGYISGSFHFNAVNDEDEIVYFTRGVFYKVPLTVVP
ncbi:hypothetical protein GR160_12600 [Flavobacterium sp. Sd200]|uniref:DUF6252 family protein n=1 Tax=Flavobacterium sp. Sd200 TaxID=2692211 RepID=UPI001369F506|nr:DUF6252 family protein [Flavobacterium sp. Sd200]MXN92067.1 hypothetical protein [Flavobacterium sp. Sd200]